MNFSTLELYIFYCDLFIDIFCLLSPPTCYLLKKANNGFFFFFNLGSQFTLTPILSILSSVCPICSTV